MIIENARKHETGKHQRIYITLGYGNDMDVRVDLSGPDWVTRIGPFASTVARSLQGTAP